MKEKLKKLASIHWIGIKFSEAELEPTLNEQILFTDALSMSILNSPLVISSNNIISDNTKYLLGWKNSINLDDTLFSKENMDKKIVEKIISDIKPLKIKIKSIIINGNQSDVFAGFIQPKAITQLFRKWYFKTGKLPYCRFSPFSSDCIFSIVECFNENYPVFSFGCEDDRKNGNISRDRLLIAIPGNMGDFIE